ncbi:MAG: DUF1684 domain-containing protein [Acidobacteria bacterium]|nr:DUF1684 domain-containing protein [Acidobacteriota bacterium]MCA1649777.1 DUF1684 domain-containing protein [Acidobacteriota bacterium]
MSGIRALVSLIGCVAAACSAAERPYPDVIAEWRAEKDSFMRSAQSPVPAEQRAMFPPLPYFAIEPDYRVPALLKILRGDDVMEMPTSTGQRRQMRRIGTLEFTLKGAPRTLTAFADAAETDIRTLFVPFGDLTNGSETYQGGRYLDLDRTATGIYDLDFNRAYHPFCVFNSSYDCPVPPRENRLPVPVRAGERFGRSPAS